MRGERGWGHLTDPWPDKPPICPTGPAHPPPTTTMSPQGVRKITNSQRRRAKYVLLELSGCKDSAIRRKLGITDRGFKGRLVQLLTEFSSIVDAPRSGRPVEYTPEAHEAARTVLLGLEDTAMTARDFVWTLEDRGILTPKTNHESYMRAFKEYLATKGTQLVYGKRRLMFALSNTHIKGRLQWCQDKSSTFTEETVKQFWFGDEISIRQGLAPKGES